VAEGREARGRAGAFGFRTRTMLARLHAQPSP
jgi:hypothetical protein